ncbi:peptidylprolyl isomerase [Egicoccus sp. AB-alg6-2]|uniref:peptidylprolyl isomerase n=1 Tax=Egicoccus sp. AB-alg6-2 TaxID=3242692 RepID=UPI00359D5C97
MSKRQHQKQLDKARSRRQADALRRRERRTRITVLVIVVFLVVGLVGAGLVIGGDDPVPEIDDVEAPNGDEDGSAASDVEPCPPADDAPEVDARYYDDSPAVDLDPEADYVATMATTCGNITIDLDVEGAPGAVANLVGLAEDGYYDGVLFHRVIDGFVIQAGDPAGTGCGQADCTAAGFDPEAPTYPGFSIPDETSAAEDFAAGATGGVEYPRGTVAMARTDAPDSTGSQFFIVQGDPIGLPDASYIVVGTVAEGMDVVDQIAGQPTEAGDRPVDEVRIVSFTVEQG